MASFSRVDTVEVSPFLLSEIAGHMRERLGIVIQSHQLRHLREAVQDACAAYGFENAGDFFASFAGEDLTGPMAQRVISRITVPESYFQRDPVQLDYLRNVWLPALLDERMRSGGRTIRVWTPGCAAGQETYTLAMMLLDAVPHADAWDIEVLGSDINAECLSTAMHGRYTHWSLRATPEDVLRRHFEQDGAEWVVKDRVKRLAKFRFINIAGDTYPSALNGTQGLDLILCRNVFIYFDSETITRTLTRFSQCLGPRGEVVVGSSDLNISPPGHLRMTLVDGFKVYRQGKPETPPQAAVSARQVKPSKPVSAPVTIRRAKETASKPVGIPLSRTRAPEAVPATMADSDIRAMMTGARWREAEAAASAASRANPASAELIFLHAETLANLGRLDAAMERCQAGLVIAPTEARGHFLHGLICLGLNRPEEAEEALKRALFLDADFVEAHFHLGMLHIRNGRKQRGYKHLCNAMAVAEKRGDQTASVTGVPYGVIAETIRAEIHMHAETARGGGA